MVKKKGSISSLLDYAGGYRKLTILGCTLSGISAILSIMPYVCIWLAAREIFQAAFGNIDSGRLVRFGWLALWFALAGAVIYYFGLICTHLSAFRTEINMRKAAAAHLVEVPLGYFNQNPSGKLRKQIDDNGAVG